MVVDDGSWLPQAPLANLFNPRLTKVARSTDLLLTSTRIRVDLGVQRQILLIAIPASNMTVDGRVRLTISRNSDFSDPLLPPTWADWWPRVYPYGQLPYGHPSWYDGKLSEEEADGYPMPWFSVLPAIDNARYLLLEFADPTNPAGHLDISGIFVAGGWQASEHVDVGKTFVWLPGEEHVEAPGGADFYDTTKPPRRRMGLNWGLLPRDEALTWPAEMWRRQGKSGQVFLIFNPDDAEHLHKQSYLATIEEPDPLETVTGLSDNASLILREVIQ